MPGRDAAVRGVREAQGHARAGDCLVFKKWDRPPEPGKLCVAAIHDASWANQEDFASQQGFILGLTSPAITEGEDDFHLMEWGSNKIHRKVRSTLGAEGAAASHALDRQVFLRSMVANTLYGHEKGDHWTDAVKMVPGYLGSDCKSLVDPCFLLKILPLTPSPLTQQCQFPQEKFNKIFHKKHFVGISWHKIRHFHFLNPLG